MGEKEKKSEKETKLEDEKENDSKMKRRSRKDKNRVSKEDHVRRMEKKEEKRGRRRRGKGSAGVIARREKQRIPVTRAMLLAIGRRVKKNQEGMLRKDRNELERNNSHGESGRGRRIQRAFPVQDHLRATIRRAVPCRRRGNHAGGLWRRT